MSPPIGLDSETTKGRILETANILFAKNGFWNTSVREIASQAEVNLSAVNYHFKNKENLYWEVFDHNCKTISDGINVLGKTCNTTEDLVGKVFDLFLEEGDALMNTLKIFLSDIERTPEEGSEIEPPAKCGPPGHETFLEKIKQDVGGSVSEEDCEWAMHMIFSLLWHKGVIMNTKMVKNMCKASDEMSPEKVRSDLQRSTRAHVNMLKADLA